MTFVAQETSQEGGRPVELYTFTLALETFRFTSAEDDQVVSGNTFDAIPIKRGHVTQGAEQRRSTLTIELPGNLDLASRYVLSAPSERAAVLIQRFHRGDGELITIMDGIVKSVAYSKDGRVALLAVEPAITATAREIPLHTFGSSCESVLGDGVAPGTGLCDVDLESPAFKLVATASASSGLTVTVPGAAAYGDNWFAGGTIETFAGLDARLVLTQIGDLVTLHIAFPFLVVGETVILRAGCDRSIETCSTKFNKVGQRQGFSFVPTRNPFVTGLQPDIC